MTEDSKKAEKQREKKSFLQKSFEKLMGKFVDAEILEPLGDALVNIFSLLDIDSKPEIKLKLFYAKAEDYDTKKKERWLCIAFRRVEPEG